MSSLVGIALGLWLAWNFGLWLGLFLFSWQLFWIGPVVTFLLGFVTGKAIVTALRGRFALSGGGLWSSAFGRRIIGMTADGVLHLASLYISYRVCSVLGAWEWIERFFEPSEYWEHVWLFLVPVLVVSSTIDLAMPRIKVAIGKGTRPFRRLWRSLLHGVGGSSRFEGILEEWANPWKPGHVFLGTSLYDPQWKVGRPDDRHFLTLATSRSGKGVSGIVPNLIHWPGSVLVIDPKGENAAVTAKRRAEMGQTVRIVDPFNVLGDLGLHKPRQEWERDPYPVFRFNPLAEVDLDALDVIEQIRRITDSLVMDTSTTNPFFDNASKKIISGVIAHVLSHHSIADEDKHLGTVRDFMVSANGRDITQLENNRALGGLPAAAAHALKTGSEGAAGDVLFTAQVHTEWLDSLAMRHCLAVSEFSLKDLKAQDVSLYLILPADMLDEHPRFLRLFVNLTVRAVSKGKKSRQPILFVLDEFHSLGTLPILGSAAGMIAGYGVKLWPISQNLSQLQERYEKSWETFMGNASMHQVFAVNDQTTARYMSERLGHHIAWRKVKTPTGWEWVPGSATWLRTSVEFARETSRDSGNQLVFMEGGDVFLLRRAPYFEVFPPSLYSPNPYEDEPSFWRQAWREMKTGDKGSTRTKERLADWFERSALGRRLGLRDEEAEERRRAQQIEAWQEIVRNERKPLHPNAEHTFNLLNNEARFREGQIGIIDEQKIKGAEREQRIADIDRLWTVHLEDAKKELGLAPLSPPEIQKYIKLLKAAGVRPDAPAMQQTQPEPEARQVTAQTAQPDTGPEIDGGRTDQPSQQLVGNGAAAEGQGTQQPQKPVKADTPRQVNGDGIDWQSLEEEWGIEPAQKQAVKPIKQTADDGLRRPPPLKPARRRKGSTP
jgi:type IV secretory pathway TraG/TraD family ATPase VirD4